MSRINRRHIISTALSLALLAWAIGLAAMKPKPRSVLIEDRTVYDLADRLLAGVNPLKAWREYRQLTLQALAERCDVTRQMLSMIEHGKAKTSADLLAKLAAALQCDMDDIHA